MTAVWEAKAVGDVCSIVGGGTPSRSNAAFYGGEIPWATIRDMKADWIESTEFSITPAAVKSSATNVLPAGTVIVASRVGLGKVCRLRRETAINQDLRGFIPKSAKQLDPQYLFLWFKSVADQIVAAGTGATVQGVTLPFLRSLQIPLPPLEEQRRIVAVLDRAFVAIATASANAEKNLANARELFERCLAGVFESGGLDWITEPLKTNVRFIDYRGKTPPKRESGIRLITAKNVKMRFIQRDPEEFIDPAAYDAWMTRGFPQRGDVLFTTEAPLGNVAQLDTDEKIVIGQRLITMQPKQGVIDRTFLKYILSSAPLQRTILRQATGATVSGIKAKLLKEIPISYPCQMDEQLEIVARLDAIHKLCQSLADQAKAKIKYMADLKRSLFQQAFAGELTEASFPAINDNWKTPAFTAQIIALAYRRHLAVGTEATFGRVKAQKALHLCESVGGVDLGRNPVKDAAGPNDFQHMLAAEDWAKANQFFEFVPRPSGSGYSFRKLARFDANVTEGAEALKPVQDRLEGAIGLIAPMNSQQAELLATVHAAWNNLLMDGAEATEAAIIYEARENWHIAKQKFADGKFRQAIAMIRAKGIEPDGSAKRVGGQEALLF